MPVQPQQMSGPAPLEATAKKAEEREDELQSSLNASLNFDGLPRKEAVAALSASLAFRRFDDARTASGNSIDKLDEHGQNGERNGENDGGHNDSLKKLGRILNQQAGHTNLRSSLELLLDEEGRAEGRSEGGSSLRSSLVRITGGQVGGDELDVHIPQAPPLENAQKGGGDDDASLNSADLRENGGAGGSRRGSLSVSLLEDRKLPPNYRHLEGTAASGSDDDEEAGSAASRGSIDLEAQSPLEARKSLAADADGEGSAAKALAHSLQRLFDSKSSSTKSSTKASSRYQPSSSRRGSSNNSNSTNNSRKSTLSSSGGDKSGVARKNTQNSSMSSMGHRSDNSNGASWNDESRRSGDRKPPPEAAGRRPSLKVNRSSTSSSTTTGPTTQKKARVSWKIGEEDDGDFDFPSRRSSAFSGRSGKRGSTSSSSSRRNSLFSGRSGKRRGSASSHSSKGPPPTRPQGHSLLSEATDGSIELEGLVLSQLRADERLLESMIELANMSQSMKSNSTWGNHLDISDTSRVSGRSATKGDGDVRDSLDAEEVQAVIMASQAFQGGEGAATLSPGQGRHESNKRVERSNLPIAGSGRTDAAITRLAHQEVDDYRTRLQRKRASMEEAEGEEAEELNELLLENATNISNALLLQRALYTLRIRNNSGVGSGIMEPNDFPGVEATRNNSGGLPRAHSEHTGIDRLAVNTLLGLTSSGNSGPGNANATNAASSFNAGRNTGRPSVGRRSSFRNPFQALVRAGRQNRRNTYQEGGEERAASAPQVGAYQSNEPAPLLFRRTFQSGRLSRREQRVEARRHTLQTIAQEREMEATARPNPLNLDLNIFDSSSSSSEGDGDDNNDPERPAIAGATAQVAPPSPPDDPLTDSLRESTATRDGRRHSLRVLADSLRNFGGSSRPREFVSSTNTDDHDSSRSRLDFRHMLRASVQRQSVNSKRLLQAILVSDEIVEADHIETIDDTVASFRMEAAELVPSLQMRVAEMECALEEQEAQQRRILRRYKRREAIWLTLVVLSAVAIIVLIIVIAVG
ncbi:hypothetical protein ACHAXT_002617 [Thalassiosira profunda]